MVALGLVVPEGVVAGMASLGAAVGIAWPGRVEHRCAVLGGLGVAYMPADTPEASDMVAAQG